MGLGFVVVWFFVFDILLFFNSSLKNTGSLEGSRFLKIATAPYPSQYCKNFKKNFSVLRMFFKYMELSGLSFSVKRGDLNIGYRLIQLEAEFCTASLYYFEVHERIICDISVMVLLWKKVSVRDSK